MALSLVPPTGGPPNKKAKDISVRRLNRIKQVQDLGCLDSNPQK